MSIARKNKIAISDQNWTVPLIFSGNFLPNYNDNSGSISRRLAVFPFNVLITTRNTTLKRDILENELVPIIFRCITAYRRTVARQPSADFWTKIAPQALRDIQSETKADTNFLANFLRNGDSYYQIVHQTGAITPLSDLEKAYLNHMRITHKQDKMKLGSDYHPIKAEGYTVTRVNLCKECHQTCTRENCGTHYNSSNRYRKVVVENMVIRTRM